MRLNFSFRGINVPKFKGMCVSCKHASFLKIQVELWFVERM